MKRRLCLREAGAAIGLGPVGILLLYALTVKSVAPSDSLVLVTWILFLVFPLALAHTVLTERAMELRLSG